MFQLGFPEMTFFDRSDRLKDCLRLKNLALYIIFWDHNMDSLHVGMFAARPPPPRVNGSYALERYENLDGWLRVMGIRDWVKNSTRPLFLGL